MSTRYRTFRTLGASVPARRAGGSLSLTSTSARLPSRRCASICPTSIRHCSQRVAARQRLLDGRITTNVLSAAGLSVLADGMAQAVERRGSWDVSRAAWISAWGASVSGLMLFFWFRLLARLFPLAASSTAQLVGKVALNQAVMSPGLNAGFFTFVVLTRDKPYLRLDGEKRRRLGRKLKSDLPATVRRSCYFWGVAQAR
mmetsp:Transcript_24695/g.82102  ORF Transcript_24695/g.82102 Transcript_24695/m.82102 type:complete len:200 (-) Transcript_24695:682-1281(-)